MARGGHVLGRRAPDDATAVRNVRVAAAVGFTGFTGFTLVMPFLPLYIAQLGVTDVGQVALWTGLTLGATPAVTAVCAPLWGRIGDRYGSKILVVRSLAAFVLVTAAMAFVTAPWQLLALRALLGLFAGYGALTVSMAAESAPRGSLARAIGLVQTGQRLGPALGPAIGGVVAPLVGLRQAFLVAALVYAAALVVVAVGYREPRRGAQSRGAGTAARGTVRRVLHLESFPLLLAVVFGVQLVDRSVSPILPLHVEQLGVARTSVPAVTGVLFSLAALGAAAGHHWGGRLLDRHAARVVIGRGALAAAAALVPFLLRWPLWIVAPAAATFGLVVGAITTAAYASAGARLPRDAHATGFGVLTSASLAALAASPVASGLVARQSLGAVFVADIAILGALAWLASRRLRDAAGAGGAAVQVR